MNLKVSEYINQSPKWQKELEKLRSLLLDCGLTEELKWRSPCYTHQNKNVVLLGRFKDYCAFSFVKGILLKDEKKILVAPGENSQSGRLIKFTDIQEILNQEAILKAFVFEAIEIEKAGLKVDFKKNTELEFTEELLTILNEKPKLKNAFNALTPGRQRGYHLYFSAAKQSKTRIARIEKYTNRILQGYGFHDCTCGHSKRLPTCDGSHKFI